MLQLEIDVVKTWFPSALRALLRAAVTCNDFEVQFDRVAICNDIVRVVLLHVQYNTSVQFSLNERPDCPS
jgi:hypothetical protein